MYPVLLKDFVDASAKPEGLSICNACGFRLGPRSPPRTWVPDLAGLLR